MLAPIIKMYATQKLNNPSLNAGQFKTLLSQFGISRVSDLASESFTEFYEKLNTL